MAEKEFDIAELAKSIAELLPLDMDRAIQAVNSEQIDVISGIIDRIKTFSDTHFDAALGKEFADNLDRIKSNSLQPVKAVLDTIQQTLTEVQQAEKLKMPRSRILSDKIDKLRGSFTYSLKELKDFVHEFDMVLEDTGKQLAQVIEEKETRKLSPDQCAQYEALAQALPKLGEVINQQTYGLVLQLGLTSNSLYAYFDKLKAEKVPDRP